MDLRYVFDDLKTVVNKLPESEVEMRVGMHGRMWIQYQ